jgi:hypothetical protein
MRLAVSVLLLVVAVVAGMLAWGALDNLFRDYKDSATSTYLLIGLPALAISAAALYVIAWLWRR